MHVKITGNVWDDKGPIKIGSIIQIDSNEAERLISKGKGEMTEIHEENNSLSKLTVAELKDLAKEKGIEGYSSMKKDELILALEELEAGADGGSNSANQSPADSNARQDQ